MQDIPGTHNYHAYLHNIVWKIHWEFIFTWYLHNIFAKISKKSKTETNIFG